MRQTREVLMKLRLSVGFALLFLSGALLLHSQSQQVAADEGRVLALEAAWNHAEQTKDVAALDQLLAADFLSTDYDGSIATKREYLASIKREGLEPEQIINEEQHEHVYGDCAVVTGIYREKGMNKGKAYSRRGRFTDTWLKVNDTWQCVASQSTLIQDGAAAATE
jgi:ketosteroid isomerase-like protein